MYYCGPNEPSEKNYSDYTKYLNDRERYKKARREFKQKRAIDDFERAVKDMIKYKLPLPDDFKLCYRIMDHNCRDGRIIAIKAYLSEEMATNDSNCGVVKNPEGGKYWWTNNETIILGGELDAYTKIVGNSVYNETEKITRHEACYKCEDDYSTETNEEDDSY